MAKQQIKDIKIIPFHLPLSRSFAFAGNVINERTGCYLDAATSDGASAQGEIAPLPGCSSETLKKAQHDLNAITAHLSSRPWPLDKDELIESIRKDEQLNLCCPSVRFGVESVFFNLAAQADQKTLAEFLGGKKGNIATAVLLQGTHEQIMAEAKTMKEAGHAVFKLKVGNRNIPLDVKNVQDLRAVIGKEGRIRLDGNRVWSFSEAVLFAQLIGNAQIEFIEEPLSDMAKVHEFYQQTHMPAALDETLAVMRCGVTAPGRCMPTLANQEGVKAYIIKPMVLGGIVAALDWIEEAKTLGKKAIISSAFESLVGLKVLKALASLTNEPAGLGTERWIKTLEK